MLMGVVLFSRAHGMEMRRALIPDAITGWILACRLRRGRDHFPLFLETAAAKHRPTLRGLEGNGSFCSALGAGSARLRTHLLVAAHPLSLALFTALGVVFELFIVEEDLLARSKNELGAAVNARQYSIGEFHGRLP
jgi:hypothetical protein